MGFPGTQSIVDAYLLGPFVQVNLKTTCPRDNKKGPFFQALLNPYFKFLTNYTGFLAVTSVSYSCNFITIIFEFLFTGLLC